MQPMSLLITTCALFVGSHLLLSHPMRAGLAGRLGERGFMIVYSIVAIATFVLIVQAWRGMPPEPPLWAVDDPLWILASLLVLVASILFMGSLIGNPAMPAPNAAAAAQAAPRSVCDHPAPDDVGVHPVGARARAGDADAGADRAVGDDRLPRARRIGGTGCEEGAADGRQLAALGGADELRAFCAPGCGHDAVGRCHAAQPCAVRRDRFVACRDMGARRAGIYGCGDMALGGIGGA